MFNRSELDLYNSEETVIYPILVHTDSGFETKGVSYILKKRFKELIIDFDISKQLFIRDLVLVNIDTLIALQDILNQNKLDLGVCINDYINYSSIENNILNQLYSFDKFLYQQAFNVGYRYLAPAKFKSMINEQIEKG